MLIACRLYVIPLIGGRKSKLNFAVLFSTAKVLLSCEILCPYSSYERLVGSNIRGFLTSNHVNYEILCHKNYLLYSKGIPESEYESSFSSSLLPGTFCMIMYVVCIIIEGCMHVHRPFSIQCDTHTHHTVSRQHLDFLVQFLDHLTVGISCL